jgi:hypothetical protein
MIRCTPEQTRMLMCNVVEAAHARCRPDTYHGAPASEDWITVSGLTSTPAYPAATVGPTFETYTLDFAPMTGDAIRIDGVPGGSADFISVGELEVYGTN